MSNSKLTREQKHMRLEWLTNLKFSDGEIATCGRFTVAKVPEFKGSRMAHFSVSYCATSEVKFRRKVGEYHALMRLQDFEKGNWVTLPAIIQASNVAYALDFAEIQ